MLIIICVSAYVEEAVNLWIIYLEGFYDQFGRLENTFSTKFVGYSRDHTTVIQQPTEGKGIYFIPVNFWDKEWVRSSAR